jgi:LCP family protein required for cell wall assembly
MGNLSRLVNNDGSNENSSSSKEASASGNVAPKSTLAALSGVDNVGSSTAKPVKPAKPVKGRVSSLTSAAGGSRVASNAQSNVQPNSLLRTHSNSQPTTLSVPNAAQTQAQTQAQELPYKILPGKKDEEKGILRIPKTYKHGEMEGEVIVNKRGFAKVKLRRQKFEKLSKDQDKNDPNLVKTPRLKFDGTFKYIFTRGRRFANVVLACLLALLVGTGSFVYYMYTSVNNAVSEGGAVLGDLSDAVTKGDPLVMDEYDRTNIAIFGTSEDDEGHGGATLTDSIMILSVNPKTGAANTISIPRDLTYNDRKQSYSGKGLCSPGRMWKINVAYTCGYELSEEKDEIGRQRDGAKYAADVLSDVTGLELQYYAKVDYSMLKNIVDIIGGIDVTAYSDDPRGIWDYMAAIKIGPGVQHLDGRTALALSRARNDWGGTDYGLSRSNFDREINQQIVLNGIREKTAASGVLLNPLKILEIVQTLGEHIVTNFPTSQFKSLGKAANMATNIISIPMIAGIKSEGLGGGVEGGAAGEEFNEAQQDKAKSVIGSLVVTGVSQNIAGSVVMPSAGEFNFAGIKAYIRGMIDGVPEDELATKIKTAEKSSSSNTTTTGSSN